jgi:DNA polymerase-3 subunit beta
MLVAEEGRLRIVGTNLEQTVIVWVGAKVEEAGAVTLPAKTLTDLMNQLAPERVDMVLNEATVEMTLTCGTNVSHIKGMPASDFPDVPQHPDGESFTLPADVLKTAVAQVAFAAAKEDNRPALTGVAWQSSGTSLTLACADGYRLAIRTISGDVGMPAGEVIVPAKTMMDIARLIDLEEDGEVRVTFSLDRKLATFAIGSQIVVVAQMLEGKFPDYGEILRRLKSSVEVVVYTDDLLRACKRADIFARDNASSVKLTAKVPRRDGDYGELVVVGKSNERGDNEGVIDARVVGDALDVNANSKYLMEPLNTINDERVRLQMGANTPIALMPEGRADLTHIIMPMGVGK